MKKTDMPADKTPLILPRLVSRDDPSDNEYCDPRTANSKYMTPFIIVVALERFTYYSIVVNLFIFFNDNVYKNDEDKLGAFSNGPSNAIISAMVLVGLSWLFCVLGGWVSDARFGKLKTIIWGLVIYAFGTGLLLLSAYLVVNQLQYQRTYYRALVVFAAILVALIGEGAYKANIAAFGAEQLDHKDPLSTRRYFNFYYFSLNIGSLLALSISAYIQQRHGFVIGFAMPFGSITLALIVFVLSRKRYKTLPCQQIVGKVYQIIKEARRKYKRNDQSPLVTIQQKLSWLDHARMKFGGSFLDWEVDEVRFLFAVIPVLIVLLPYQTIYNQMNVTFLQQGIHMNITILNFKYFPAAWLFFFNAAVIVVLVPIMEKFVYPWLTKRGYEMIPLTRISIGIVVACFAIIAAGFVEIYVVHDLMRNNTVINHNVNKHNVTAARLSIFYQVPQYVLIGISEVFANVGGLEFAYRNAPRSMQGMVMALFFAINSLGSLVGSGLLALSEVSGLIRTEGCYDLTYYFFLLGALMLVSWIIFIIYVERNRRKRLRQPRTRMFSRTRGANSSDIT